MRFFCWPENSKRIGEASIKNSTGPWPDPPQWHKPILQSPVMVLCGEVPTVALRLKYKNAFKGQWQQDIEANGMGESSRKRTSPVRSRRISKLSSPNRRPSIPIFAVFYDLSTSNSPSTAAGAHERPGPAPTDHDGTLEIEKLRQACALLQGTLHELKVDEKRRELIVLPFVR